MSILGSLQEHREAIIKEWIDVIYGTYPFDTVGFLRSQSNAFSNPVGAKTKKAAETIVTALLSPELDSAVVIPAVDELIRVRAIQKFAPDQAMAVIFFLKTIIRKHVKSALTSTAAYEELLRLEAGVDSIALQGFNIYSECRDKVQQMRVDEFKRVHSQLLRRAERILEKPVGEPDNENR
ncbi:MAG: RsbRD N-terminal domain-containing protein [Halodesulfovibrio sp.]